VEVLMALAQTYGAEVREHTPVQRIEIVGGHPLIHTQTQTISADKVVVSAGAWLPKLVPQLQQKVEVALEATVFFKPQDLGLFSPERFPIFITHGPDQSYGFPVYGLPGIKVALHHGGSSTTADSRGFDISDEYIQRLRAFIRQYLPQADGPAFGGRTCIYTNTANKDFILDHHPESDQVIIASPCSGHGFKFVPVLGEIIADLAQGKQHPLWFERFRLG
jgi:sarcosine oxidase